jgi:hypothetical protein
MATQTCWFNEAPGIRFGLVYNDASLPATPASATALRVENSRTVQQYGTRATVDAWVVLANGTRFERSFAPGNNNINLPGGSGVTVLMQDDPDGGPIQVLAVGGIREQGIRA